MSGSVAERLSALRERIEQATQRRGPGPDVHLLGVSKRHELERLREAYAAGLRDFGENFAQELARKRDALSNLPDLRWHFIGGLQRNKAKLVADCAMVHTVDRAALVDALAKRASSPLDCLVEVNFGESQKAGAAPDDVPELLDRFAGTPLRCAGLMIIPPAGTPEQTRPHFARLRELRDRLAHTRRAQVDLQHLSMGMSSDFEVAIEEGATIVRVGTALFGPRQQR